MAIGGKIVGHISKKVGRQLAKRGWDPQLIDDVLNNPYATRPSTNRATGNSATAYFRQDGSYVIRDGVTGDIIQVSNKNDPNWIPDPAIHNPYRP